MSIYKPSILIYNPFMLISVVMASYNYEKFLAEAINSVIAQTFSDWELIIVDDGSNDGSLKLIEEFCAKDSRIKLFTHKNHENKGLIETLKLGISKAQGDWIAFLESDDLWDENCLQTRVTSVQNSPAECVFNDVKFIGEVSKKLKNLHEKNRNFLNAKSWPCNMFYDFGVRNRILTFSSGMIKKDCFKDFNWNCPSDKLFDWWLYIHIAYSNKFLYINRPLSFWRIHRESFVNSGKKFFALNIAAYFDVFKKHPSFRLLIFIPLAFLGFVTRKIFEKF